MRPPHNSTGSSSATEGTHPPEIREAQNGIQMSGEHKSMTRTFWEPAGLAS
jgi:hypothetical protein